MNANEYGKGFAVMADDVRKLAECSQTTVAEISELASNSVQSAKKASSLIHEIIPSLSKTWCKGLACCLNY